MRAGKNVDANRAYLARASRYSVANEKCHSISLVLLGRGLRSRLSFTSEDLLPPCAFPHCEKYAIFDPIISTGLKLKMIANQRIVALLNHLIHVIRASLLACKVL